ncbi:hypothetical protein C0992_008007, partial [Termitomyces sp. T32_za158]
MQAWELRRSKQLKENVEAHDLEAQGLADARPAEELPIRDVSSTNDDLTVGQALNSTATAAATVDSGDAQ